MRTLTFFTLLAVIVVASSCKKTDEVAQAAETAKPQAAPVFDATPAALIPNANEVVVSVNDAKLTRGELAKQVEMIVAAQMGQIPPEQALQARAFFETRLAQSFVAKTLLLQEAQKIGLKIDDADTQKALDRIRPFAEQQGMTVDDIFKNAPMGEEVARKEFNDEILIEKLIDVQVKSKLPVDDKAIEAALAEKVKERGDAKKEIEDIRKQLLDGAKFETLAEEKSDCPSGKNGGDLGTFGRGQMVKPFENAAFSQEVNAIGPVIETDFGFHIVKVTERNGTKGDDGKVAEPDSVKASHILIKAPPQPSREAIVKEATDKLLNTALKSYLDGLKANAKIINLLEQPAKGEVAD